MTKLFKDLIEDDIIKELLDWPTLLIHTRLPKFFAIISCFYIVGEVLVCGYYYLAILEPQLRGQYALFGVRSFHCLCAYATLFAIQDELQEILLEVFPNFWSLRCLGEDTFMILKQRAKLIKAVIVTPIILILLGGIIILPLNGNEYDLFLPVKLYEDYVGKNNVLFVIFFLGTFMYFGMIIISNLSHLAYLVMHLTFQSFLLSKKIQQTGEYLSEQENNINNCELTQSFVRKELSDCIKQHQNLIRFGERINKLIYMPVFGFTLCGISVVVSVIYFVQNAPEHIALWSFFATLMTITIVVYECIGQLVVDESEWLYRSLCNFPWYLLNSSNKKIYYIMVMEAGNFTVLSSSGIVTVNAQHLILMLRNTYSIFTFLCTIEQRIVGVQ